MPTLAARAQRAHQRVEQRRLAGARRAGDADAARAGGARLALEGVEQRERLGASRGSRVVDEVQRLGHRVAIARAEPGGELSRTAWASATTSTISSMMRVRSKSFGV